MSRPAIDRLEQIAHGLWARGREGLADSIRACINELEAELDGVARFTTNPPCDQQDGVAPVEQRFACLYTQVKPCKDIYPDNTDRWCGYCLNTHAAVPVPRKPK